MSIAASRGTGYGTARAARPVRVAASNGRTRLRITRRGRVVLAALVAAPLVLVALLIGLNGGVAVAGDHETGSVSFEHVTVESGQSLWQIAETIAPHDDPRDVVSAIVDLNQLQSSLVTPGQSLAIPAEFDGSSH